MYGLNSGTSETHVFSPLKATVNEVGVTYKLGGVTIDWANVAAVSGSDVTLNDGQIIKIGEKYLRYGTVVYEHTDGTYRVATDTTPASPIKGKTFVLEYTLTEKDDSSPVHGGALDGGKVYKDRLLVGGAGQMTLANFNTALPNIMLVY